MRIAHLSDLHLRHHLPGTSALPQRASRRVPELLAKAARRLHSERPDVLVLTGDLLDYPLDLLQDEHTRMQGEQDLRLVDDLLAEVGCPVVVIPGNHDHEELVQRVFAHSQRDRLIAGHRIVCFCDREGEGHVPHRIGQELLRFRRATSDATSASQVHVQHYLVWPKRNQSYPHTYAEAEKLVEAIAGSGIVRLVLSGHYHQGIRPFRVGETVFAAAPAFCEAPHSLWTYDLATADIGWSEIALDG